MTRIRRVKFVKLDHRPSAWIDVPTYFITICTRERGHNQLCGASGSAILRSIQFYHEKGKWYCDLAVLMPDHVHLLVSFGRTDDYGKVIGDWKRWVARHHGIEWQENFFEHRLRQEEGLDEKALYILQNPVRARLVAAPAEWPYFWQST